MITELLISVPGALGLGGFRRGPVAMGTITAVRGFALNDLELPVAFVVDVFVLGSLGRPGTLGLILNGIESDTGGMSGHFKG